MGLFKELFVFVMDLLCFGAGTGNVDFIPTKHVHAVLGSESKN